ncbi:TonB-dependent receptor domain-containing protein [Pectinatus cerevisiiphilus]|nr:TonB-dependent receptor [Pectinatus cerevisiiphilus]
MPKAWAADEVTDVSDTNGQLTDNNQGRSEDAFSDRNITSANDVNGTANVIQIAGNAITNYDGNDYQLQGKDGFGLGFPALIKAINSKTGSDYNAIIFTDVNGNKRVAYATDGKTTLGTAVNLELILRNFVNDETGNGTSDLLTANRQKELYDIIKSGDQDKLKDFLKKYLPNFQLAKINDLSKIKDIPTSGWNSDALTVSDDNISNISSDSLPTQNWELFKNNRSFNSNTSTPAHSYDSKNISNGSRWRPMDRVIYVQSQTGLFNDKVTVPQYWNLDANGNVVDDTGQTGDVSWDNTAVTDHKTPVADNQYTAITVGNLTTGKNSVIDLTYANTVGGYNSLVYSAYDNGFYLDENGNPTDKYHGYALNPNRIMYVDNASLGEGTTFRLGNYVMDASLQHKGRNPSSGSIDYNYDLGYVTPNDYNSAMKFSSGHTDSVYITDAAPASGGKTDLYIELGWVPGIGILPAGDVILNKDNYSVEKGNVPVLVGILHGDQYFNVLARKSLADGVFSTYEITPYIVKADNYFTDPNNPANKTGTAWYLSGYSFADTGEMSSTGKAVSDNSLLTHNLWRENYLNMFRRTDDLHARYKKDVPDGHENTWGQVWHGKLNGSGAYGNSLSQNYTGWQGGYDKLLNKKFYNGKVYTGFFLSKVKGSSGTSAGSGNQDSMAVGIYGSWVGDKGHFLDAGITADRLSNDYNIYANLGDGTGASGKVTGDYSAWGYNAGIQYGKRNELSGGWWYEPAAALFFGTVDSTHYKLSNHLGIDQKSYNNTTGRLRLRMGRDIGTRGDVYGSVGLMHEFAGDQDINAFYGYQQRPIATNNGNDTWLELKLGTDYRISPNGKLNLEFARTAGQNTGNNWSINGRLDFTWDGFGAPSRKKTAAKTAVVNGENQPAENISNYSNAHTPTMVIGAPAGNNISTEKLAQPVPAAKVNSTAVVNENKPTQPIAPSPTTVSSTAIATTDNTEPQQVQTAPAVSSTDNNTTGMPSFDLGSVTVEAKRPEWENQLSPGQVSVVYTDQYKGEQKDLPAMLQSVPGLYVQKVSGTGHYTVARVRGATGAQVNVYVDGVPMNLNGESAVNLSALPVDNVERIEVYRGYVPARFAGAPIGGVINIVTKKPNKLGGSITQGFKSYGGYNGTYQLTTPLGDGSLLATYQRDIWRGDYDFTPHYLYPNMAGGDPQNIKRQSNGYQNNNGMLKWQDDHWMAKISWKDLHENLPANVGELFDKNLPPDPLLPATLLYWRPENYEKGFWDSTQDTHQKEFLVGRRDTFGKLDFGWQLSYLDNKKDYLNTGYYKRYQALQDAGIKNPEANGGMQDITSPGGLWAHYHSKKWNLAMDSSYKMGANHLLEIHGDMSRETMDADVSGRKTYWSMLENLGLQYIHQYKINEYHFNIQDTITLNDAGDFKFTPIIRLDKVDMQTMSNNDRSWKYSGGAALQKQLNDHWSFKTTWGTYNRHPNFYELFGDGATIAPNAGAGEFFDTRGGNTWEHGTQFDFSLNWQGKLAGADTDTVLTWFQRRAKNQFALWTPVVPNSHSTYFPMDEAKIHGIELTHNMKWHRTTLNLAATWQKPEYSGADALRSVGSSASYKTSISYTPEWVINARLDYLWPKNKLNTFIEWNYMDKQFTGQTTGSTPMKDQNWWMSSLTTVNVGAKYKFNNNWALSAGVNDLFNRGPSVTNTFYYRLFDYSPTEARTYTPNYPLPGRMYYMTLEYKF